MALFNYASKEITLKIVYYGPGLSGKTSNLKHLHKILTPETRGKLLSLATEGDRTLFFDFLPVELGKIRDFSIRFQLYTVPGQVRYNATRKVVLKGADGIVFVADSQRALMEQNSESLANMRENLQSNNINPDDIPVILQYNKRDLDNIASADEMDRALNLHNYRTIEAVALDGNGVEETFKLMTKMLLQNISKKHKMEVQAASAKTDKPAEDTVPDQTAETPTVEQSRFDAGGVLPQPEPYPDTLHDLSVMPAPATPAFEQFPPIADIAPSRAALKPVFDSDILVEQPVVRSEQSVIKDIASQVWSNNETEDRPVLKPKEAPAQAATEEINLLAANIRNMQGLLLELKMSVSGMTNAVKGLAELKKEQEEHGRILRDLLKIIGEQKPRNRWFRF